MSVDADLKEDRRAAPIALIEANDKKGGARADPGRVVFAGPLDGQRRHVDELPDSLLIEGRSYVRSVRCTDGGEVRYAFHPDQPG